MATDVSILKVSCNSITLQENIDTSKVVTFHEIISFLLFPGWFGIRKDFCHFLLSLCPFLQEYANIAYSAQDVTSQNESSDIASQEKSEKSVKKCDFGKTVVPIVSIDMPD